MTEITGLKAKCAECKKVVRLNTSGCPCQICRETLYLQLHKSPDGKWCSGSGHGVKKKDIIK